MYLRASELRKSLHFHSQKLLFLSIFCWYFRNFVGTNHILVGLHVPTDFQMYRQNSEKALWGGGGGAIAFCLIWFFILFYFPLKATTQCKFKVQNIQSNYSIKTNYSLNGRIALLSCANPIFLTSAMVCLRARYSGHYCLLYISMTWYSRSSTAISIYTQTTQSIQLICLINT